MACHHWGKLVPDIGVTFKEDLLVGPIEIAEFVAGNVDIQSSRSVVMVWTLKCLSLSFKAKAPMRVGWEYLYSPQRFPVSRRSPADCHLPKLVPRGLFLPGNYPNGIHGPLLKTTPRNHSSSRPGKFGESDLDDQHLDRRFCWCRSGGSRG